MIKTSPSPEEVNNTLWLAWEHLDTLSPHVPPDKLSHHCHTLHSLREVLTRRLKHEPSPHHKPHPCF